MKIHVLGAGAGGGFPQWNCNCHNCARFRKGEVNAEERTQSSIAVSADGVNWLLINASPDILAQIAAFPPLQPGRFLRDSGIVAVVLVDSQIDHSTGLLMLRESKALNIYCTKAVHEDLTHAFPILEILRHYCDVNCQIISTTANGQSFEVLGVNGLRFTAIPIIGKAPPYSNHRSSPQTGDNIAIYIEDVATGKSLFYGPGIEEIESKLYQYLEKADCLLIDGTFWHEDEMIRNGVGSKYAKDMGHIPQFGLNGSIATIKRFTKPRKILIHINNTNPILDADSAERAILNELKIEVATDGMNLML